VSHSKYHRPHEEADDAEAIRPPTTPIKMRSKRKIRTFLDQNGAPRRCPWFPPPGSRSKETFPSLSRRSSRSTPRPEPARAPRRSGRFASMNMTAVRTAQKELRRCKAYAAEDRLDQSGHHHTESDPSNACPANRMELLSLHSAKRWRKTAGFQEAARSPLA